MREKDTRSTCLGNNLRSFAYLILIGILSLLLMLNRYLAYAWPDSLALPLLLLVPLGMTLKKMPGIKKKFFCVALPLVVNVALLITAYTRAGGFPHEIPEGQIGPWLPLSVLNPGVMAMTFFADPSRIILRYGLLLFLPSGLLLAGMLLREQVDRKTAMRSGSEK